MTEEQGDATPSCRRTCFSMQRKEGDLSPSSPHSAPRPVPTTPTETLTPTVAEAMAHVLGLHRATITAAEIRTRVDQILPSPSGPAAPSVKERP